MTCFLKNLAAILTLFSVMAGALIALGHTMHGLVITGWLAPVALGTSGLVIIPGILAQNWGGSAHDRVKF